MPVTGSVSSGLTSGDQTSLTFSHTSNGDALYVLLSWFVGFGGIDNADRVTGITFDGVALERGGHLAVEGNTHEWWRLVSPGSTTANVVITLSVGRRVTAAALNLSGWPSSLSDHTFAADGDFVGTRQPSVTVTSDSAAEVLDWLGYNDPSQVATPGAGQTEEWSQEGMGGGSGSSGDQKSNGSLKAGASSVTMSWTLSVAAEYWGLAALSFLPTPPPAPEPSCTGGGAIDVVPDPTDGDAFEGRVLEPRAWFTAAYDDEDRHFALDAGNHPSTFSGRKIGNLIRYGTIRRALSGRSSPYQMSDCTIDVDDSSRLLSTLQAASASQHWQNREGRIRLATKDAIASGGVPWTVFRGIWRGHKSTGLRRSLNFTSVLGSEFSDFNLERTLPTLQVKDDFPDAPKDSLEKYVPIAYGIYPDPAYAGSGAAVTNVVATPRSRPAAPTGFTATPVVDASGDGDLGTVEYYAVTAIVGGVESDPAYVSAELTGSNNAVDLAWDSYSGATQINLYCAVRSDFLQFARLATQLSGGATSYRDIAVLPNQDRPALEATGVWLLGERWNVQYWVYPVLSDGSYGTPGVSNQLVYTPIDLRMLLRDADVTWDAYTGAVKYLILRHVSLYSNWRERFDLQLMVVAPTVTVADVGNDGALIDGGYDNASAVTIPEAPTGCIPAIPCGQETIGGTVYNRLLITLGAWRHVEDIYISRATSGTDTASSTGTETTYDKVDSSAYGSTWLAPGQTGWSDHFDHNYVEYGSRWYTVIFTTLDPLPQTVLVNGCGLTDVSDGTGSTIDGAARQIFHLLQNFVLPPADEAWSSGDWLAARTFNDGTPVINTGSLTELERIETDRIGRYYRGQIYLDTAISLRDVLARLFVSFGIRFGENEHGQVIGVHLDEFADLSSVIHLTDVHDLVGDTEIDERIDEHENEITYDYGYRPARTGQFLKQNQVVRDTTAIGTKSPPTGNLGHVARGDHRQMYFVDDPVTAVDVVGRDLGFGKYPPRYVTIRCTLHSVRVKLGSIVVVDDVEGIGATGWTNRPLWVLEIQTDLNDLSTAPMVTLVCVDVQRFLDSFGLWASDAVADWGSATDDEKAAYGYWSLDTDLMSDGAAAKSWS